jgi:hypothetical protein
VPEEHPTRSKGITTMPMRQVVRLIDIGPFGGFAVQC